MKKIYLLKISLLFIALMGSSLSLIFLQAQPLFSVSSNTISKENVAQIKNQITDTDVFALSLTKNNNQKEVFSVQLSSAENTQLIILNEQTGDNVVITPVGESLTEFQLAPFFMEELKQSVLGTADRYLILEVTPNFSVKHVASVTASTDPAQLPQYFYGKKENVKEALPQDRQIIKICKQKPHFILEFPDNLEHQQHFAQLEETMSYYIYMYKLPDGTLATYNEHFNRDNSQTVSTIGNFLEFSLTGELNATQRTATEFALELWSYQLAGTVPVDISVDFKSLGQSVIGYSEFPPAFHNPEDDTWYPSALWNQLMDYNVSGSKNDIILTMNSDFGFYYELDANTNKIDYVTIMLHEACHGLGFGSNCSQTGVFYYGAPGIYDRMLYQGLDGPCWTELSNSERSALMVSNNLYAGGPGSHLLEANEGVRVKIYAPTYYSGGSSVHHWANEINFPSFMKYAYDSPLHTFNNRKIGMMMDMGWTAPEIAPNTVFVNFDANGGLGYRPPQPFIPDEAQNLCMNPFVYIGYLFLNWNTEPDGSGISYEDRENITISNNITLYAQWKGNEYTLGFYPYGGTVNPASKQVTFGQPIGELPIPEKAGYVFNGWRLNNQILHEETIWRYAYNLNSMAQWILGVSENQQAAIQIYPNPANQTIELRINNEQLTMNNVEIYDIYGRLISDIRLSDIRYSTSDIGKSEIKINISHLPAGLYFVKITTEAGIQTQKLIKL